MSEIERDDVVEKMVYEAGFLLDPALTDEVVAQKQEAFKSFLTDRGAEIIAEGTPENKKLAYTMEVKKDSKRKDFTKAFFSWIKFDMLPETVGEVDQMLKDDSDVIRYLLVKTVRENTLREPLEGEEGFVEESDEGEEGLDEEEILAETPEVDSEVSPEEGV